MSNEKNVGPTNKFVQGYILVWYGILLPTGGREAGGSSKLPRFRRGLPRGMEIPWGVGLMTSTAGIPRSNGVTRVKFIAASVTIYRPRVNKLNIQLNLCEQRCHAPWRHTVWQARQLSGTSRERFYKHPSSSSSRVLLFNAQGVKNVLGN